MSFSRPGPKRDDALSAVVGGKGLETRPGLAAPDPLVDDDELTDPATPPGRERLVQHEQTRSAALSAGDKKLADQALHAVIGDLDALLAAAATELRASASGRRTRKQVKKAVPQLIAIDERGYLPLTDVADLLELSRDDVDDVLASLAARGEFSRDQALAGLASLRTKLQEIETTRDHSLLSELITFVVKIALLSSVAASPTPLDEAVKTGILALVATALQRPVDRTRRDPYAEAQRAHENLLDELTLARNLTKTPAYEGEHAILRFRLQVRCASARVSSLPLNWPAKEQYWQTLDQIALALDHDSPKSLILIRRKLEATPVPLAD
ncbi:hypothetical protein [Kribbella monticola]|uniref:hypothetical protein n=1 Tax=Kribbella monticola TaxID=2185285 RepID=UPI001300778B|nr:hypothetical protein [Kribbella monticola]